MSQSTEILVSTRFSFLGASGWQSDFSKDAAMLFDKNRLLRRLWLFNNIALASLASQTDDNFHHFILSSDQMPDWAKSELTDMCEDRLGAGKFTIQFAPQGPARKFQRHAIGKFAGSDPVAQVVLDDDDGLSSDFIATLRAHLAQAEPLEAEGTPHFYTFPKGYALGLRDDEVQLWAHRFKFINLGLTMVGRKDHKNIFGIGHMDAPKRFGYTSDTRKLMYIRTLSDVNDSRVSVGERWTEVENWRDNEDFKSRFPWMLDVPFKEFNDFDSLA